MRVYSVILLTLSSSLISNAPAQSMPMQTMSGLLRLIQSSPLPSEGYMDHMAVDVQGQRLFICGEANKSLIVVDLRSGKVIHETNGLGGNPRKPFYLAESNEIWTDLGDNTVVAISGSTYQVTKTVVLSGGLGAPKREPDNAAYDPSRHQYYAAIVTGPAHGTVTVYEDGSLIYTPTPGYMGVDSFTYKVTDGTTESAAATVTFSRRQSSPVYRSHVASTARRSLDRL